MLHECRWHVQEETWTLKIGIGIQPQPQAPTVLAFGFAATGRWLGSLHCRILPPAWTLGRVAVGTFVECLPASRHSVCFLLLQSTCFTVIHTCSTIHSDFLPTWSPSRMHPTSLGHDYTFAYIPSCAQSDSDHSHPDHRLNTFVEFAEEEV